MLREKFKFKISKKALIIGLSVAVIVLVVAVNVIIPILRKPSSAEQWPGSPESGATSRIKEIYDSLVALGLGSESAGTWGDWGAYWNRIRSAAEWVPNGTVTVTDVKNGITFYDDNRTVKTGTYPNPSSCPNQQWYDSHASATQQNNCNITWQVAAPPVAGDDSGTGNHDPRTGLIWSQYLKNDAGVVGFAASGGSDWSWDGTTDADSVAVGSKTPSQLCSERGNGWRLPSEKELMQAYIDGSFWNLSNPAYSFWSRTEYGATGAYYVNLSSGGTVNTTKTVSTYVRCVR